MNNYTYVTLVSTDDFLWGAVCMILSLKKSGNKYPVCVLVSEACKKETKWFFKNWDQVIYKEIPNYLFKEDTNEIYFPFSKENYFNYYRCTLQKFEVFKLTEFDKVFFLDADYIIKGNIDNLLDKYDYNFDDRRTVATKETWPNSLIRGQHFIVKPSLDLYTKLWAYTKEHPEVYPEEYIMTEVLRDYIVVNGPAWGGTGLGKLIPGTHYAGGHPKYWVKYEIDSMEKAEAAVEARLKEDIF